MFLNVTRHGGDQPSTVFPENYAMGPGGYIGPLVGSKGNAPCGGLGAKQSQS